MVKDISIEAFDYPLPEDRIPLHPLAKRDECKLLVRSPQGRLYHKIFRDLPDLLPPGALLICNDTKVINARLTFHKPTGATVELFLLEPTEPADYALSFQSLQHCQWKCLVGNSKKWKDGAVLAQIPIESDHYIEMRAERDRVNEDGSSLVDFYWDSPEYTFAQLIEKGGEIPIPPYLNRESEASDQEDYQTVYARIKGSVAAPTAGLHFTPAVFEGLEAHAVKVEKVTLHVGAGTFRPVKTTTIGEHPMHSEPFSVRRELIEKLIDWKTNGKPVTAVGTTTVRTLESLPYIGKKLKSAPKELSAPGRSETYEFTVNQWDPYDGKDFDTVEALKEILNFLQVNKLESLTVSTSIMIAPGFKWRITDAMVTNFHQPKSTLLLLVSSFLGKDGMGYETWREMYEEALSRHYRFLSYGDACLLLRR